MLAFLREMDEGEFLAHNKGVDQKLEAGTILSTELREIAGGLLFFKGAGS